MLKIIWNVSKKNIIKIGAKIYFCSDFGDIFFADVKTFFFFEKKFRIFFWGKKKLTSFLCSITDAFGLKPHNQLVIGYHRLAFLNQVLKKIKILFNELIWKLFLQIICNSYFGTNRKGGWGRGGLRVGLYRTGPKIFNYRSP